MRLRAFLALLALLGTVLSSLPAAAITILRDAEMERALRELARPIIGCGPVRGSSAHHGDPG